MAKKIVLMTVQEEEKFGDEFYDDSSLAEELNSCCGMGELNGLENLSLGAQIYGLQKSFEQGPYSQIILTDTMGNENKIWKETKAAAYKGPITVNPKSKNQIRLYIVTKEILTELENQFREKKEYEAKFKGTPVTPKALAKPAKSSVYRSR